MMMMMMIVVLMTMMMVMMLTKILMIMIMLMIYIREWLFQHLVEAGKVSFSKFMHNSLFFNADKADFKG